MYWVVTVVQNSLLSSSSQIKHMSTPSNSNNLLNFRPIISLRKGALKSSEIHWDSDTFRTTLRQAAVREIEQRRVMSLKLEALEIEKEVFMIRGVCL